MLSFRPEIITDVIFDLDGTLIDSAESVLLCMGAALAAHGISPVVPLAKTLIGPPLRETLNKISGCEDKAIVEELALTFMKHYDQTGYRETHVFSGVDDMLHELKAQGLRLHIATNKRLLPTELIISHMCWTDLFCAVYALDICQPSFLNKNEMLAGLLRDQKLDAKHAVYIGDRYEDLNASKANGLEFFAATWGYRDEQLNEYNPRLCAASPYDITRLLYRSC